MTKIAKYTTKILQEEKMCFAKYTMKIAK